MRQAQKLTPEEKTKLETSQEMYTLIRLLDIVEKCYNFERISEEEYRKYIEKALQKYQTFQKIMKNFDLSNYIQEYGLQECEWAIQRIKDGVPNSQQNRESLLMQTQGKFIEILDALSLNQSKPCVSAIKPHMEDLLFLLNKGSGFWGSQFKNNDITMIQSLYDKYIKNKSIVDILSESEFTEIQSQINSSYQTFYRIVTQNNQ